jgi:TfoX/Sxy family transcriptional regulator of competence genes
MAVDAALRKQVETDILARGEVKLQDMMGTSSYFVRGRMFAFWVADGIVAKLPDKVRQEFLDQQQGALFQGPQGRGTDDWTRLTLEKKDDLEPALAAVKAAYEHIRGLAERRPRSKAKKRRR